MLELFKKMLRDIRSNKVQFASVFLMALLGIMIYSGIEGVWLGMDKNSASFYERTDAVTDWVYGRELTEEELENITELDDVEQGTLSMQFDCSHVIGTGNGEKTCHLQVNTFQNSDMNRSHITDGSDFSDAGDHVCWLDQNYAAAHAISVGDRLTLRYTKHQREVTVAGTVISPEYVSYTGSKTTLNPNHELYGYCYINENTAEAFLGDDFEYNVCKLITDNAAERLSSELPDLLEQKFIISYDRSNHIGVQAFTSQITQLRSMSFMFSALFLLLSLLSMQTTMKRLVETQRTQIGTLKALGFTNLQIMLHYALYGFFISAVGAALGLILGPRVITPLLITVQKDFYTLPRWSGKNSFISLAIILVTILTCTVITILACRDSVHLVPAEAMRNKQVVVKEKGSTRLENALPFEWKWSVRYILRNKMRTLVGVIGVAGCLVLMMASVGLYDSLHYANQFLYGVQYHYKNKIVLNDDADDKTFRQIEDALSDDVQYASEWIIQIKTAETVYPSTITVVDKGYYITLYRDVLHRRDQIALDEDTVLISSKLAEKLGVSKGQTVKVKLAGYGSVQNLVITDPISFILTPTNLDIGYQDTAITDVIYMPAPQGIVVSADYFRKLGFPFQANCVFTNAEDMSQIRNLEGVGEVTSLEEQYQSAETVLDSAMMIVILLIAAGVVLSIIILFNLGILNFTERIREYSTLKVLGFENGEIKSIIMKDTIITSAFGILIGIPLGIWFLRLYVGTVSTTSFDYYPHLAWYFLAAVIAATLLCAFAVNYVVVSKIKRIDMVEALKSVE